jgi:exonuclease SbcC
MIPIKLTIEGLYSYRERQSIEFDNLVEAQLFGIFGSVGSGKSSILEAITFALYGKTERLNQRDGRNYNMMNLKSNELYIDFRFRAGKEEKEFRFTVKGRRNSRQFDDVGSYERSAYFKSAGEWVPLENPNAEAILGLSYDNFKRTIIIPQGNFQEFLQLGTKDRTQMLKEIFQLEKYDLGPKVNSLIKQNDLKKSEILGALGQIEQVDEESIKNEEIELTKLDKEVKALKTKLDKKQKDKILLDQLKSLYDQLIEQNKALDQLKSEENSIQQRESKLKNFEYCTTHFKNQLDRKHEKLNEVETVKTQIEGLEKEIKDYENELKEKEEKFILVEKEYKKLDDYKKQFEELQKLFVIKGLDQESKDLSARIKKGQPIIDELEKKLADNHTLKDGLNKQIKEKEEILPDEAILRLVEKWFDERKRLEKSIEDEKARIQTFEGQIKVFQDKAKELFDENLLELLGRGTDQLEIEAVINLLQEKHNLLKEEIILLQEEKAQLIRKESLEDVAANLEEGDPCPVCGSIHHPDLLSPSDLKEQLADNNKRYDMLSNSIQILSETQASFTLAKSKISDRKELIEQAGTKVQNYTNNLEQHLIGFTWEGYRPDNYEFVIESVEKTTKINNDLKELRNKISGVENEITKTDSEITRAKDLFDKLKSDKLSIDAKLNTLRNQIELLDVARYESKSKAELDQEKQNLGHKTTTVEKDHKSLSIEIDNIKSKLDTSKGGIKTTKDHLQTIKESLSEINENIKTELEASPFNELDKISQILDEAIDIEEERKAINAYKTEKRAVESKIADLEKSIDGKDFDVEKHAALKQEIETLELEKENRKEDQTRLQLSIEKLKTDLKKRTELKEKLSMIENRGDNLATLNRLFRSSGFVNYVSSVYLHNLCKAANERFHKLTRQKLSLEMTDDNNFQVRDYLNEGKVRNVKTLSGGQTFQASLSLALTLAESVQKENETDQNFFFLDEGFGSQDKESLQIVFETLKSLRKENRVVGIISHVEELKQEIDVYLDITNSEEKGSTISESWK